MGMYALVDTVIDFGFPMLETYSEQIQALEDELMETKNERLLGSIHELRRELLLQREFVAARMSLVALHLASTSLVSVY